MSFKLYLIEQNIISINEAPRKVGGDFYCYNNMKQFSEKEVQQACDVGGDINV